MADYVLTNEQRDQIAERADNTASWRDDADLERRRRIGQQFCQQVESIGILNGETITREQFCQLVSLQWQIQNLNPMQMPRLLGLYAYKVHFGNFQGTFDDLKSLRQEQAGTEEMHEGVDLTQLSECIRQIGQKDVGSQGKGASDFLELEGAGQALVSGFLHLLHPEKYGLVNKPTRMPFSAKGWLGVTRLQRREAVKVARSWFSNAKELSDSVLRVLFCWEVFLTEVRELCGFEDFHEVDQFIWSLSVESTPDTLALTKPIVDDISARNVEIRRQAEANAKRLLEENLGKLTAEQMKQLLDHLGACGDAKDEVGSTRFGPGTVGANANLILEKTPELNEWVERLWKASDEQIPHLLDEFWQQDLPGLGRLFPTAILYLRDKDRFAVWTSNLDNALHRVIPGLPSKTRTGFGYQQYCKGVQQLRKKVGFPPEMHDWVLFRLTKLTKQKKPESEEPKAGEFAGFTENTFRFMGELTANNNQTWFQTNKPRFRKSVDRPLRALVRDLGSQVMTSLDPQLETAAKTNKCIARIRKNVYGRKEEDVYQNLYWAAFYRRGRSKQSDCQFFLSVRGDGFRHGIYFGEEADDVRQQLTETMKQRRKLGQEVWELLKAGNFSFAPDESDSGPRAVDVEDYDTFCKLVDTRFHVFRHHSPSEAEEAGGELVQIVGKDFRLLYPLFLLATSGDAEQKVRQHLDSIKEGSDEDDDTDDDITIARLTEDTLLEEEFFERLNDLLKDKQQLVLSGPPGTSKTFVALKYADYLTQGEGEVRTVQFHPSYGYEDFIEGLRPSADNGALTYSIEDGIFKKLCDDARSDPAGNYVLLIDEINRGNLPRIFGELLFLLERREETTILPYSKKPFSIPQNIYILGTMNTSDRSIALMDLALRRRFHFVTMEPEWGILRKWLKKHQKPMWIAGLFDRLNTRLQECGIEADRLVGHAHFMSRLIDEEFISVIWDGSIHPLLRELFFTEPERLAEFTLEKMRGTEGDDVLVADEPEDEEVDDEEEFEDEADVETPAEDDQLGE